MLICDLTLLRLTLICVPHREKVLFQLERPIGKSNIKGKKWNFFWVKIVHTHESTVSEKRLFLLSNQRV